MSDEVPIMALSMRSNAVATMARFLTRGIIYLFIYLFISPIKKISKIAGRLTLRRTLSREVVENDKATKHYTVVDARKTQIVLNGSVEGTKSYWTNLPLALKVFVPATLFAWLSNLPLALKVSVPVTLFAWFFIHGKGAGIAAFGSATGVPVILLVFVGTTAIMTVIAAFVRYPNARPYLAVVLELVAHDETLRKIKAAIKSGRQGRPKEPVRSEMPDNEREVQENLLAMDPVVFESHVMSFFKAAGMLACVTKKSNDKGVDGFARHPEGLIVVQCKRYAPGNPVGRPSVQQFWGAIEENEAWRGYFVTTSRFTDEALGSAERSAKLVLVEMSELVRWHKTAQGLNDPLIAQALRSSKLKHSTY